MVRGSIGTLHELTLELPPETFFQGVGADGLLTVITEKALMDA